MGFKQMSFSFWSCVDSGHFSGVSRPHLRRSVRRRRLTERSSGGRGSCSPASLPPEWSLHCGSGHRCLHQGCSWKIHHQEAVRLSAATRIFINTEVTLPSSLQHWTWWLYLFRTNFKATVLVYVALHNLRSSCSVQVISSWCFPQENHKIAWY